mmetsp:Transcript_55089/g.165027  ORF Transcript_55089/g.165027 Transcript_55089/m.165027 type:complete len:313 (-) Transcript_55089:1100-2038(-)
MPSYPPERVPQVVLPFSAFTHPTKKGAPPLHLGTLSLGVRKVRLPRKDLTDIHSQIAAHQTRGKHNADRRTAARAQRQYEGRRQRSPRHARLSARHETHYGDGQHSRIRRPQSRQRSGVSERSGGEEEGEDDPPRKFPGARQRYRQQLGAPHRRGARGVRKGEGRIDPGERGEEGGQAVFGRTERSGLAVHGALEGSLPPEEGLGEGRAEQADSESDEGLGEDGPLPRSSALLGTLGSGRLGRRLGLLPGGRPQCLLHQRHALVKYRTDQRPSHAAPDRRDHHIPSRNRNRSRIPQDRPVREVSPHGRVGTQ